MPLASGAIFLGYQGLNREGEGGGKFVIVQCLCFRKQTDSFITFSNTLFIKQ